MIKIEEIQKEINSLSMDDFKKLRDWIIEKEWGYWDKEIKMDSESGKLDFLIEEAQDADISDEHKALLNDRVESYKNNPESNVNWQDVQKRLRIPQA